MTKKDYLKELHGQVKEAYNHMKDASKPAADEGRAMNAEELEAYDKFDAEYKSLEETIARVTKQVEQEKRLSADSATQLDKPERKELPEDKNELDAIYRKAFWLKIAGRTEEMTDVERKAFTAINKAQSTTDAAGGYTIPTGFSNQLEVALKWYGPMMDAGMVFDPGTGGNDFEWPTLNDTTNTGKLLAEAGNATTNANDLTFAQKTFKAYKFSSDLLAFSAEIALDSAFSFETILAEALAERIGRVENTYLTTGTGSSQPQGVVTGSSQGAIADGNLATEITRANLITLQHSVDKAYRSGPKVGYMFHDSTLAAFKKLAFGSSDARPLWVPSMRDGEPSTLEGFRYWVNNDMAEGAASAKTVLFGNFDKFKIRKAGPMRLKRSDDIYIATDQSAIVLFDRLDSLVLDGGGGAIKYMRQLSS
jgi:HK97 family phage major capsid protein